jgi:hypothetical protein
MSSAASFGKLNQEKEKTWQLKATYVEVRLHLEGACWPLF